MSSIEQQIAAMQESLRLLTIKVNETKHNSPVDSPVDSSDKKDGVKVNSVSDQTPKIHYTNWSHDMLYKKYYLTVARLCNIMIENNVSLGYLIELQYRSAYSKSFDGNWVYKLFVSFDSIIYRYLKPILLRYFNINPLDDSKQDDTKIDTGYNVTGEHIYYTANDETFNELCVPLTLCRDIFSEQLKNVKEFIKNNAKIQRKILINDTYSMYIEFSEIYDALTYCIIRYLLADVKGADICVEANRDVRITFHKNDAEELIHLLELSNYTTKKVISENYIIYDVDGKQI